MGAKARPYGPIPVLQPGHPLPHDWVVYECQLLNAARILPLQPPSLAKYGRLQKNRTIRYKRAHHPLYPNAICGLGCSTRSE